MQDSIQTQQAPATPQVSIPSSAPAPTQAYQSAPAQSAQPSYQIPSAPQPEASYQQTAPAAPEANPWQQAFERLSDSLSATQSSQPQAAYSTPTPQAAPSQDAAWQGSAPAAVPSGSFRIGAADLNSPSNAGVFPGDTGAELQQRADRTRERRVSRKRQRRKS